MRKGLQRPGPKRMLPSRVLEVCPLLPGLMLVLVLSLLACRSMSGPAHLQGKDFSWVCPEFADLPLRQGRFQEAVEQHLTVLEVEPENALAHYHLGYAYGRLGARAQEVKEYCQAVELGLEREDLYYNLGMAYGELGRYDRAEQALTRAVARAPKQAENHRALGMVYYRQGNYPKAIACCRRATALRPEDPEAWHCLALALAAAGEIEEMEQAVNHLRQLAPDYHLDPMLEKLCPKQSSAAGSP